MQARPARSDRARAPARSGEGFPTRASNAYFPRDEARRSQEGSHMTKLMRRSEKSQAEDLGAWDPLRVSLSRMDPFRMVREMFQDPFGGIGLLGTESVFRPNLDVTETNDAFAIHV